MTTKTIAADKLRTWLEHLIGKQPVFAPQRDADGFLAFKEASGPQDAVLEYGNTAAPAKVLFFPRSEVLFELKELGDAPQAEETLPPDQPWVLFGARLCDTKGLVLLDLLFQDREPDPYYTRRRETCTIVALACGDPELECFCESTVQGLSQPEGADIVLTPLEGRFLVEAVTEKGEALLQPSADLFGEASEADAQAKRELIAQAAEAQLRKLSFEGITEQVQERHEDEEFWQAVAQACLGCGICTFLCPTCSCFDVQDEAAGAEGKRYRCWDSCQFGQFCVEASGHDPREQQWQRQRNRIAHKLFYSVDRFGRITCVGCGRCIRHCPVNIDITRIISQLQSERESKPASAEE
jgi:sulfhydrogenase subunit beta (sulfur reductase)